MNAGSPRDRFGLLANSSHGRSSRNPAYDSSESRRSPRSRSPPRYNEFRDDYRDRGGASRGGERRRSISDSRQNSGAFASNRDLMRDSTGRDSSRDFPPREIPRGPKAEIDGQPHGAPRGPRGATYGGDFRGDFGYRGDFRGGRGRARARGSWRDDSRDRGREADRDFRGPRDDRGPPPFRDDRSRDRDRWDRHDSFRGRRPSSPQGRGRSPNYGARERETPSSLDIDRARRGSRDGPLSGGSPSEPLTPFRGGYGRGRGRGRGRGGYYDNFTDGNRSPDPTWTRRTQASTGSSTPPPQVPAFGTTANAIPIPTAPKALNAPTGPAFGTLSNVPTAPRALQTSRQWISPDVAKKELPKQHVTPQSPAKSASPLTVNSSVSNLNSNDVPLRDRHASPPYDDYTLASPREDAEPKPLPIVEQPLERPKRKRQPAIGTQAPIVPTVSTPPVAGPSHEDSDSDDSIGNGDFFEEDIQKIEDQLSQLPKNPDEGESLDFAKLAIILNQPMPDPADTERVKEWEQELEQQNEIRRHEYIQKLLKTNHLAPRPVPDVVMLLKVLDSFTQPPIDAELLAQHSAILEKAEFNAREAAQAQEKLPPQPEIPDQSLAVQPATNGWSRPMTPMPEPEQTSAPHANGNGHVPHPEGQPSTELPIPGIIPRASPSSDPLRAADMQDTVMGDADEPVRTPIPIFNGKIPQAKTQMELMDDSDDEKSLVETEEQLQGVRKMMRTPPLSSLPNFNCKPWDQNDEFVKFLEPDPMIQNLISMKLAARRAQRETERQIERKRWQDRYLEYRMWTDRSRDEAAVTSREMFARAREAAAAEAANNVSTPGPRSTVETGRRGVSRFSSEHEFAEVLRLSALDAKEKKDREDTASAKEAAIPEMCWGDDEWEATAFRDQTHLVPFERSFAILEYGEPVDNFTEEENTLFEKAYLEYPKQWGKIAEALTRRDYKACIQHYYLVKHSSGIKEKLKKQGRKRGRAKGTVSKGAKPKSNALMADIVRVETEDGENGDNGGERRGRPRRAAAPVFPIPDEPVDSATASPAPTPGRKTAATPKLDSGNDVPTPKPRKTKPPREKTTKQSKSSQLLAAAPTQLNRRPESPPPAQPTSTRLVSTGTGRFPAYDAASVGAQPNFTVSKYPLKTTAQASFDDMTQSYTPQDRLDSMPPMTMGFGGGSGMGSGASAGAGAGADAQDRRSLQQTSSYWSVPEQTDFPALLRHFGTDWHGIAKFMTTKTHIMVKNYYQRQVDSGKRNDWANIATEADQKRQRGESTGPLPAPTLIPAKTPGQIGSSGSILDGIDDGPSILRPNSPPPPGLGGRFPALAQAGGVQQTLSQPATPTALPTKHLPSQQVREHGQSQMAHQRRPQGPPLGYFVTEPQRPLAQVVNQQAPAGPVPASDSDSHRSKVAATFQQASLERQSALRIQQREQFQAEQQAAQQLIQQQQQQAQIHERRQLQMKQENDVPNLLQYEPYSTAPTHANASSQSRPETFNSGGSAETIRRTAPPTQYQPRANTGFRGLMTENANISREVKSTTSPGAPRAPMSAPPASQEQFSAPPPAQAVPAALPRLAEPKRSNLMSLLNDDPAPEPARPAPSKRLSDVASSTLQQPHTPPPQHGLQGSRYSNPTPTTQSIQQLLMTGMPAHLNGPPAQHPFGQSNPHHMHHHSLSAGQSRSFTPTGFDNRGYGPPPPAQQQQQLQSMYAQPSRAISAQPPPIRRESSRGEMQPLVGGYAARPSAAESSVGLMQSPYAPKESYTATPPSRHSQPTRQQITSPLDHPPPSEREYYARQQYHMQQQQQHQQQHQQQQHQQQQANTAGSPQLGPSYHQQSQSHRQMAFGQGLAHVPSPPPPPLTTHHPMHPTHQSQQNSFDNRYPNVTSSGPGQPYTQAPQHHALPQMQHYQQQPQQVVGQGASETRIETERRRMREEEAYLHQRLEEQMRRR